MPIERVELNQTDPTPLTDVTVAVVTSRYNAWVTEPLESGALDVLERQTEGGSGRAVLLRVSGSMELPTLCAEAAMSGDVDAVVALGCVIRGETEHDRHIARAVVQNLTDVSAASGVPIGVGVLTVNDAAQAEERAGGRLGNKGAEAMEAALESVRALRAFRRWSERESGATDGDGHAA